MKNELLKPRMSTAEMTEAYASTNPIFHINRKRVGMFAKKNGYVPAKQMIDGEILCFYVKKELLQ